jgi:RNA-directed DNA polymerase
VLMRFLEHRIGDRRVLRLIAKWLKAGVMEEGAWTEGTVGTPQGAVISPLLANIYLHYVYDLWVDQWRKRRATGEVIVIRYADDTIVGFKRHADADRFLRDLRERLATFGLDLHPDKTRLIEFGRFAAQRRSVKGLRKPETFDFLGFTHICGKRPDGAFILLRQTIAKRMRAKLLEIKETLYRMCHLPVPEQGRWLGQVLRGYFAYHAVPTNSRRTTAFAFHVVRHWRRALMRRSQKAYVPWRRMKPIAARWIPSARIRHPWPQQRFLVKHPRWEPSALAAHARICPGGAG